MAASEKLAEKSEAEDLEAILGTYERYSNECANLLAKLESLDGAAFKELTTESKAPLSPELLSDIIRSAKEEIGRHKHNLHVIRRNMSKNRMRKIAGNSAPIKAKELIDFLIHNGLIDVRRNASVVIKAFVSGFLSRFQLKSDNVRGSFDRFVSENKHVIRNNQGGTPDSNRRLAMNAFVRGFEEARVYQETGNESSAPLTMAIIHVTGGDLFGEDTETDKLVADMCLQVPSLIKQGEKLVAELDRTVEMLEHAISLYKIEKEEKNASSPVEQSKNNNSYLDSHNSRNEDVRRRYDHMGGQADTAHRTSHSSESPFFMASTQRDASSDVIKSSQQHQYGFHHSANVLNETHSGNSQHVNSTGATRNKLNSTIKGERLFRDTTEFFDDDSGQHASQPATRNQAHSQLETPIVSNGSNSRSNVKASRNSGGVSGGATAKRLTPQSSSFLADTQSSVRRKAVSRTSQTKQSSNVKKSSNVSSTKSAATSKHRNGSSSRASAFMEGSEEEEFGDNFEEADAALEEMWRTLETEDALLSQEAKHSHAIAMRASTSNERQASSLPPRLPIQNITQSQKKSNLTHLSPPAPPLHTSLSPQKPKSSSNFTVQNGHDMSSDQRQTEAEILADQAIKRAQDIAKRASDYEKAKKAKKASITSEDVSKNKESSLASANNESNLQAPSDFYASTKLNHGNDAGTVDIKNHNFSHDTRKKQAHFSDDVSKKLLSTKNETNNSLNANEGSRSLKHSTLHVGKLLSPEKPKLFQSSHEFQSDEARTDVSYNGDKVSPNDIYQAPLHHHGSLSNKFEHGTSSLVSSVSHGPSTSPGRPMRSHSSSPTRRACSRNHTIAADPHDASSSRALSGRSSTTSVGRISGATTLKPWIPGGGHKKSVAGDAALSLRQIEENHRIEEEKKKQALKKKRDKLAAKSRMRRHGSSGGGDMHILGNSSLSAMSGKQSKRNGIVQQAECIERLYQGRVGPTEDEMEVRQRMEDPLVDALNDLRSSQY